MKLKLTFVVMVVIGVQLYANTPTSVSNTEEAEFLPYIDLGPYGLDGFGLIAENATEGLLRIRNYRPMQRALIREQILRIDLQLALTNKTQQYQEAMTLADQRAREAAKEKALREKQLLNGLLIGGAVGVGVGLIGGILIYSAISSATR